MTIEQLADYLTRHRAQVVTSDEQDREVIEDAKKEIKKFASQKCKEQREMCAKMYRPGYDGKNITYDILNAPEPKIE